MVLDTSITIKWLKNSQEIDAKKALAYYKKLRDGKIKVIIPDLMFYELSNFGSRQPSETFFACQELMENIFDPDMRILIIPPDNDLTQRATTLAHDFRISAYDAFYLAVAEKFNTRLVTADKKLLSAAPDLTIPL